MQLTISGKRGPNGSSNPGTLEERLVDAAERDPIAFLTLFKGIRNVHTEDATRASLRYLAKHGSDAIGTKLELWLAGGTLYLRYLLDPDFLPEAEATTIMRAISPFSSNFTSNLQQEIKRLGVNVEAPNLRRARLICQAALGDAGVLIPWLRQLNSHPNEQVRAKASKILCEIRPNIWMMESRLKSDDPRVRADAVESLWSLEDHQAIELLTMAAADPSSRVMLNALVGLHLRRVDGAFEKILSLACSPIENVRLGVLWAIGFLADRKAADTLIEMTHDASAKVSARAKQMIEALGIEESPKVASVAESETIAPPTAPAQVEEQADVADSQGEVLPASPKPVSEPAKPEPSKKNDGRKKASILDL